MTNGSWQVTPVFCQVSQLNVRVSVTWLFFGHCLEDLCRLSDVVLSLQAAAKVKLCRYRESFQPNILGVLGLQSLAVLKRFFKDTFRVSLLIGLHK